MKRLTLIAVVLMFLPSAAPAAEGDYVSRSGLEMQLWNSGYVDAFGRLRTSNPETVFDGQFNHDKDPLFWDESITDGSGNATSTHSTLTVSVDMYIEATDQIVRQTKTHWATHAGKAQLIMASGVLDTAGGGDGVTARIGAFTATSGYFFELHGDTVKVVVRRNGVDMPVIQSAWNIDKMLDDPPGADNPSGQVLDPSQAQIFTINYGGMGMGSVWFGLVIEGRQFNVHRFDYANTQRWGSISTANLPIRYEITSAAGGDDAKMRQIACNVMSEAGAEGAGVSYSASTAPTHIDATAANSIYALIGIRLRSDGLDANVFPEDVAVLLETADAVEWMLLVNPTVWGTFTYTNLLNSDVAVATGATANTITSGSWDVRIKIGFVVASNTTKAAVSRGALPSELRLGSLIDGTPDEFILAARSLTADADIQGALMWREQH